MQTPAQTDTELIGAIRRGDPDAAEILTRRYYQRVYNTCLRYLKSQEDCWDITQEIFMKIIAEKRILQFRGQAQLWTWLFRIAVNTCKTWLVRRQRSIRQCVDESWLQAANLIQEAAGPDPEQELLSRQEHERLNRLLSEMPENYRRVLHLVYWEDYSYQEAAEELNIRSQYLGVLLIRGKLWLSKRRRAVKPEVVN